MCHADRAGGPQTAVGTLRLVARPEDGFVESGPRPTFRVAGVRLVGPAHGR